MFRQNTGIDLNDFPALGAPASNTRANPAGSIPQQPPPPTSLLSNRFANYPSSSSNSAHLQETLLGANNGPPPPPPSMSDYISGLPNASSLESYPAAHHPAGQQLNSGQGLQSRTLSMDDFPALRSSGPMPSPFGGDVGSNAVHTKQDSGDYNTSRESLMHSINGGKAFGPGNVKNMMPPSQWMPSRTDTTTMSHLSNLRKSANAAPAPVSNREQGGAKEQSGNEKPSDSYGLLGLLGVIRMTDPDRSMLALGSDLTTLGLDLNTADSIYSTFISPWSDTQTPPGLNIEPGYYLPPCYQTVQATPPAIQRMRTFSDEILFYIFYSMPKDIAQEAAAQELYARNWRYHKESGVWLTKEADENGRPVQGFRRTSPSPVDRGVYVIFNPATWQRVKREWILSWDAIEDRQQQQQPQQLGSQGSLNASSQPPRSQPPQQPGMAMQSPPNLSAGLSGRGVML